MNSNDPAVATFINEQTSKGWIIEHKDDDGIQLIKRKKWSAPLLIIGLITLLFWGFGLILLVLAVILYLTGKDEVQYLSYPDIINGDFPAQDQAVNSKRVRFYIFLVVVVFALIAAIFGLMLLIAT